MAKTSITKRWLINSLGIILIILIGLEIVLAFFARNFYYAGVEQALEAQANRYAGLLTKYSDLTPAEYADEVRGLIEDFDNKDKMELMVINQAGDITLTSSGFEPDNSVRMPDYEQALLSDDGFGEFRGVMPNGESFMAISFVAPNQTQDISAMRLVVSLSEVNKQILTVITVFTLVGIAIIFFVVFSSSYFINSIVIPVGEVGKTARKIAAGDFDTRLTKKNDDEIGELCDIINYMAGELGAAEKMKNDFISSVSHELRTPMTAIKGWVETLMSVDASDTETMHKGMKVILNETDRLSDMVEELLDFSRMQSGRITLVMNKTDIIAELDEAVIMFTERAKREGLTLKCDLPEYLPPVSGDRNRLKQVFVNVLDNAMKYSDSGDTVYVSAHQASDTIIITIRDTGCGIGSEDLPKVKTKFYKGNQSRRGSGIGLAVADEIIRLHGGTLDIDSEKDVGTVVTITLPIYQKKNDDAVKE